MQKKIAFRVDASSQIGAGHMMRCIELCRVLDKKNYTTTFISKDSRLSRSLLKNIKNKSFIRYHNMFEDIKKSQRIIRNKKINALIIDSYLHDENWEKAINIKKLIAFDDTPKKRHFVDMLIDMGSKKRKIKYKKLLPKSTEIVIGTEYRILRDEFIKKTKPIENPYDVFICFGGSDNDNFTEKSTNELLKIKSKLKIVIILGPGYNQNNIYRIKNKLDASHHEFTVIHDCTNISEQMNQSKIIITAPGGMAFEAASLGKDIILIKSEENQQDNILLFKSLNAAFISSVETLSENISNIIKTNGSSLMAMQANKLCDGKGKYRLANKIIHLVEKNNANKCNRSSS